MTQRQFETLKGLLGTPGGLSEFFRYFSGITELFRYGYGPPEEAGITRALPRVPNETLFVSLSMYYHTKSRYPCTYNILPAYPRFLLLM